MKNAAKRGLESPKGVPRGPQKGPKTQKRGPGAAQERPWASNMPPFRAFWGPDGELLGENVVKMDAKTRKY